MSTNQLPEREEESWSGVKGRAIRRLLDDCEALKVDPHRMGGICNPALSKRVRHEQVAELIGDRRLWDRDDRQKDRAHR